WRSVWPLLRAWSIVSSGLEHRSGYLRRRTMTHTAFCPRVFLIAAMTSIAAPAFAQQTPDAAKAPVKTPAQTDRTAPAAPAASAQTDESAPAASVQTDQTASAAPAASAQTDK